MSISSDEVNFLIYRYLQESGFQHSAFTFGNESLIANSNINGSEIPPGALITFLQKGLQYKEIETHLGESGQEINCDQPFTLLSPHICQTRSKKSENHAVGSASSSHIAKKKEETQDVLEIHESQVTTLKGHTSEVFICAWNPAYSNLLASGSGDSTARVWTIPDDPTSPPQKPLELIHMKTSHERSKDVTTLEWNFEGNLLATGSYDGIARIWSITSSDKGELRNSLVKHKGPIFSLKWNKKGDCLLSGSVDKTAIIWDVKTGDIKQQFEYHIAPTLDVDWKDDYSFASCSTDKMIYVCALGKTKPLYCFQGHTDEVNAIK